LLVKTNGAPWSAHGRPVSITRARETCLESRLAESSAPAREDTREVLESLLLHIGTAYETEIWGKVRRFIVLDVINDLVALTVRSSLLHLMSVEG
jgi:hypothetical protein